MKNNAMTLHLRGSAVIVLVLCLGCDKKSGQGTPAPSGPVSRMEPRQPHPFERDTFEEESREMYGFMGKTKDKMLTVAGKPDVIRTEGGKVGLQDWDEAWLYETKQFVYRVYFCKGVVVAAQSNLIEGRLLNK